MHNDNSKDAKPEDGKENEEKALVPIRESRMDFHRGRVAMEQKLRLGRRSNKGKKGNSLYPSCL